ncbi:MAG: carboxypeptidase regulatory-like domain-containing protein [Sandaracinaceae bacterium]
MPKARKNSRKKRSVEATRASRAPAAARSASLPHPAERSAPATARSARTADPRWRRAAYALAAIAAIALASLAASRWAGTDAAGPAPTTRAGGGIAIDPATAVTLTLEPAGEAPDGTVHVLATIGGETLVDAEGRLPFALVAPRGAELDVQVEVAGRARYVGRIEVPAEDESLAIPLPPGARIEGRVLAAGGEPVEGAEISVLREDVAEPAWVTSSSSEGRFMIDTLRAGSHRVQITAPGRTAVVRSGVVADGEALRIELDPACTVAGRVLARDGTPASGATVEIAGSGLWPPRTMETDAHGRFVSASIPPGVYELRARRGGMVAEPRRGLDLDAGERVFVTLALADGARLVGRVVDADTGQPIEGAAIMASAESLDVAPRAALSGPDGRFVVAGLRPQPHRVTVTADGYVASSAQPWSPGDVLDVGLVPGGTLVGVVLDERRRPIEGAIIEVLGDADGQPIALDPGRGFASTVLDVQLHPMALEVTSGPIPPIPLYGAPDPVPSSEPGFAPAPLPVSTAGLGAGHVTDAEGAFTVAGVPPGHVQVFVRAPGYAPAASARFYVGAGQRRDDLAFTLSPAGRLHGHVRDARGDAVEGVLVEARSEAEPEPRIALTDDRGAYAFEGIAGELTVTALPNGAPAARTRASVAPRADVELDLALDSAAARIRGRTVDARGVPLASVSLELRSLDPTTPFSRQLFSEADGTFSLAGLPDPPWRITADSPDHARTELDVFEATDDEIRIALVPSASVRGRLLDDYTGEPVAGTVELRDRGLPARTFAQPVAADGHFGFSRVPVGPSILEAAAPGYVTLRRDVEVRARGTRVDDLDLDDVRLTPAGRIEGTVVDALGQPVARADVSVDEDHRARTEADGTFVLGGLPAGSFLLRAAHPAAGATEREAVRVLEGRETPGVVLHLPERLDPSRAGTLGGQRRGVAIELAADGAAVIIRRVVHGSRAEHVGLRTGDRLLAVDGADVTTPRSAARALTGPLGVPALLVVERDGEAAWLFVERERWLAEP